MSTKIQEYSFRAPLVREYSITPIPEQLGMASNKMTLFIDDDKLTGNIIWGIEYDNKEEGDDEVSIGLWFEGNRVIDFDGVFELPEQAITILVNAGYDTEDVE